MFRYSAYAVISYGSTLVGRLTCRGCGHSQRVRFDPSAVGRTRKVRCSECEAEGSVFVAGDAFEPTKPEQMIH